jgi:lysophospholipase L1-like esterase
VGLAAGRLGAVALSPLVRQARRVQKRMPLLRTVLGWHSRALDRELRQIARRRPVVTHVAMPPVSWPEMFAKDRFHPNTAAYRALASHFAAAITAHG